jgi:hypothetical protein
MPVDENEQKRESMIEQERERENYKFYPRIIYTSLSFINYTGLSTALTSLF